MIEFHHTYKTYPNGQVALRDVCIEIERGSFVFLTGPSGAGKTTLFRLISAYDRASSGQVIINGFDLVNMNEKHIPEFRRRIGVVYQDFRLLKNRTVFENVALPLEVRGDRAGQISRRVTDILDQVGLVEKSRSFPDELSGGEQQRVAIARALIHQPGVLVADEPTGNLDPQLSWEIMEIFDRVNAQGTTVFVATHDHELVRKRKKRNIEIARGEVVAGGAE